MHTILLYGNQHSLYVDVQMLLNQHSVLFINVSSRKLSGGELHYALVLENGCEHIIIAL